MALADGFPKTLWPRSWLLELIARVSEEPKAKSQEPGARSEELKAKSALEAQFASAAGKAADSDENRCRDHNNSWRSAKGLA